MVKMMVSDFLYTVCQRKRTFIEKYAVENDFCVISAKYAVKKYCRKNCINIFLYIVM